jgi:exopolyphosphatase/guanosine-5'-triphosphate,3'-diphosphate pyrophosphatase
MALRVAAIDAGTNTFRLLIADRDGGVRHPLCKLQRIPRLGRDYQPETGLCGKSMLRAGKVLQDFSRVIDRYAPDRLRAVTTSIVREANNGHQFLESISRKTGIDLEVISGQEEARLTACGVLQAVPIAGRPLLIFDIGGGSTEFVLVDIDGSVRISVSYPFGVVKLTEKYLAVGPLRDDCQVLKAEIDGYLDDLVGELMAHGCYPLPAGTALVGTSGTMTTFAAMDQNLEVYDPKMINGYSLSLSRLVFLHGKLWEMDIDQRRQVHGLERGREDVIIAGGLIVLEVIERLGFDRVTVSDDGLLEGVALSLLAENQ